MVEGMVLITALSVLVLAQKNAGPISGGVFTAPSGLKVELMGVANGDTYAGPVYGADGKPLSKAKTREFVKYEDKKSYLRSEPLKTAPRLWFVMFRVTGPTNGVSRLFFQSSFEPSMMGSIPADPKKGKPHMALIASAKHPTGPFLDIPLIVPSGEYQKISTFGEDGATFDEGFFVEMKKSKLDAFAATEQDSQAYTRDGYQGWALIPMKFKGMELYLRASDQKSGDSSLVGYAGAVETGVENGSLKVQLFGRLPIGKERAFSLYARPTLRFTMRLRLPSIP